MSAVTAAYAAEAVKPSARVRGDGPTDEAITLLSVRSHDEAAARPSVPALRAPASLSMMLMGSNSGLPQGTRSQVLNRYLENCFDEPVEEDGRHRDFSG